jgi:Flp pilus assembly protein TadG
MSRRPVTRLVREERGLLVGSAIRLVVAFSLLALTANEVGQLILAKVHVENAASAAAQAGANEWLRSPTEGAVREAAQQALAQADPDATITDVQIADRGVVTVQARETAHTILLHRLSFLRHYGVETAEQEQTHNT